MGSYGPCAHLAPGLLRNRNASWGVGGMDCLSGAMARFVLRARAMIHGNPQLALCQEARRLLLTLPEGPQVGVKRQPSAKSGAQPRTSPGKRPSQARNDQEPDSLWILETSLMNFFRDTGDARAFDLLYRLSAGHLEAWIAKRSMAFSGRPDSQEILQDAFVNIYRYGHSFQGQGPSGFRRWARTIAANAMNRSGRPRALPLAEWCAGHLEISEPGADPAERAAGREEHQIMANAYRLLLQFVPLALANLSPRDRYVLQAIHVHGASYREVEAELDLRTGGLKMIVHRARMRLRAQLSKLVG